MTHGLILSGGGARGAYQIGVLKALAELLPDTTRNPFPVICGTSAGAINALSIAGRPGLFRQRVAELEAIWNSLRAEDVYRADAWGVLKNSVRLGLSLLLGQTFRNEGRPVALLDNAPLRALLEGFVQLRSVDDAIARGELLAVTVTAMDYGSGEPVSFFQGDRPEWRRSLRRGVRARLTVDHLLASAAIPTIFPAVAIDGRYYGDGAMRQLRPVSPALRLGADRLFIVSVGDTVRRPVQLNLPSRSPSVPQMINQLIYSAFIDALESDLEILEIINKLNRFAPTDRVLSDFGIDHLRPIEHMVIQPSASISAIAEDCFHELPLSLRVFLRATRSTAEEGAASATSYLLFEPGFCRQLIALGYRDTLAREAEVTAFFATDSGSAPSRADPLAEVAGKGYNPQQ
jgi:NTE family protein